MIDYLICVTLALLMICCKDRLGTNKVSNVSNSLLASYIALSTWQRLAKLQWKPSCSAQQGPPT